LSWSDPITNFSGNTSGEVGLSPTVIQNIRSGKQKDIKLENFKNIVKACGYDLVLEKGEERILVM
jgi:hypothetical protein